MHPRAEMFLREREAARARRDPGVERCMNVELARMGYTIPVPGETTQQPAKENTAKRRPKPRCEHGRPPDRCDECNNEFEAAA